MINDHHDLPNSINFLNDIPEPMLEDDSFIVPVNCSINNFVPIYNSNSNIINWNPSLDLSRVSVSLRLINEYIDYTKVFLFVPMLNNGEISRLIKELIDTEEEINIELIKLNNSIIIGDDESHVDYSNGDTFYIYINNIINIGLRERSSLRERDNIVENFNNNLDNLVDYLNILIDTTQNNLGLDDEIQNETLTDKDVENIPCKKFRDIESGSVDNSDTCIICQECYSPDDKVSVLNCNHTFHKECLDNWLLNYNCVCPFCRTRVNP